MGVLFARSPIVFILILPAGYESQVCFRQEYAINFLFESMRDEEETKITIQVRITTKITRACKHQLYSNQYTRNIEVLRWMCGLRVLSCLQSFCFFLVKA